MIFSRLARKARLAMYLAKADTLFNRFDWSAFETNISGKHRRDLHAIEDAYLRLIEIELEGESEALYQCYPWYQISLIEFVSGRVFQAGNMLRTLILRIQCMLADLKESADEFDVDGDGLLLGKLLDDSLRLQNRVKRAILVDCREGFLNEQRGAYADADK